MLTIAPPVAPPVTPARAGETGAFRVRLTPGPVAAAQARRQVRLALAAWNVPVDADIAVLLTSDLVTYAIRHAPAGAVTLGVRCTRTRLTVDVHDSASPSPASPSPASPSPASPSPASPSPASPVPASPSPGRPSPSPVSPSLALVARQSTGWGCAQTPAGRAVYFTLAFGAHG